MKSKFDSKPRSVSVLKRGGIIVATLALSLGLATHGRAQNQENEIDPEVSTAAKQLLETLEVRKSLEPALAGITQMQEALLNQQNLDDEQIKKAREIMAISMEEAEKALEWENLEGMFVRIYSKVFSAEEINELIKLFESPTGKAYIKKQPELQAATMQEMQTLMLELMPKIQEKTKEAIERAKAE